MKLLGYVSVFLWIATLIIYFLDLAMTIPPTIVTANREAVLFAAKACSCYGDTKRIDYREKEFDFYCNDGVSYGKFIPYTMVYQGENCVGNP
jgi:hypothetical protein